MASFYAEITVAHISVAVFTLIRVHLSFLSARGVYKRQRTACYGRPRR